MSAVPMRGPTRAPTPIPLLLAGIEDRSAAGVAGGIGRLVRNGTLPPGTRLPTVRGLAAALGASPTTVSQAWTLLARAGLIDAQGRRGTFVADRASPRSIWRVRRTMGSPGRPALDFSTGTPDLALLPDLSAALAATRTVAGTRDYYDAPVVPALAEALAQRWPYEPEMITVVDGAMDALDRVVAGYVHLGSPVLVENPGYPPLLDLLELVGARTIPLTLDDEGVVPASLAAGLAAEPVAVFLQPRAHNPTGTGLTARRARALVELLAGVDTLVVEDDHGGDIVTAPALSLGAWLPATTVHIHGFSKSYGPDLRLAAVSGSAATLQRLVDRRLLGPGWSSRLLQAVLWHLLADPATQATVQRARETYRGRREALLAALAARGVRASAADGINAWVEVADEHAAMLALASAGFGVAAGTPFEVAPLPGPHVRITAGLVRDGYDRIAAALS